MTSNVEGSPLRFKLQIHHAKAYRGGTLIQVGTRSHSSLDSFGLAPGPL